MELNTRFPVLFASCRGERPRYEPRMVSKREIIYDSRAIPLLTEDDIDRFVDLQRNHTTAIDECFRHLMKILEIQEQEIIHGGNETSRQGKKNAMNEIYAVLTNLNEHDRLSMIDNWVLFLKSQRGFSYFF